MRRSSSDLCFLSESAAGVLRPLAGLCCETSLDQANSPSEGASLYIKKNTRPLPKLCASDNIPVGTSTYEVAQQKMWCGTALKHHLVSCADIHSTIPTRSEGSLTLDSFRWYTVSNISCFAWRKRSNSVMISSQTSENIFSRA